MARYVASILAFAWAASASVLVSKDAGALTLVQKGGDDDGTQRKSACRYCHKLCPISCFVGTCGLNMAYSMQKFEATNQCYSCDPSVSVGISKDGDYMRCEASESGVPDGGASPFSQQQGMKQGPQGPAVPGNAGLNALKASQQAQIAVAAATRASIFADKAAKAATAKYREIAGIGGGADGKQVFDVEKQAESHQAATQIRAEEALRVAEAAHTAWQAAMGKYNEQLLRLRKQQLLTDQTEKTLEAAEASSEKARGLYAAMQAEAQSAAEQAMLSGGSAAAKITSQAASEELAGAAMAAHRRLVIAAKEAKDASEKIAIASAMAPCMDANSGKASTGVVGCMSIAQKDAQDTKLAAGSMQMHLVQPALPGAPPPPSAPVSFGLMKAQQIAGLEDADTYEEPAVAAVGQLEIPSLEQQMTANLAEKLANNPGAVNDPSLFAVPHVGWSAGTKPRDGMEMPESFDLSTIAFLQKGRKQ